MYYSLHGHGRLSGLDKHQKQMIKTVLLDNDGTHYFCLSSSYTLALENCFLYIKTCYSCGLDPTN